MDVKRKNCVFWIIAFTSIFTLTFLNQALSAEKRAVVLATMNWEPYYGQNLPNDGFFTAICRTAFQRAGYEFNVTFVPWARAVEGAKDGTYDGVMGGYYTEERTQHFLYTDVVTESEEILLSLKSSKIPFSSLRDLAPYRIGGIRGGAIEAQWKATGYLTVEEVSTYVQNLEKLRENRIDAIIGDRMMWQYLLNTKHHEFRDLVEEIGPIIQATPLYLLISKKTPNHTTVVTDFNRALKEIKTDGSYEKIIKQYGLNNTP